MALTFKKTVLLTGAGFTANFGGLLAREMWSKILNNTKMERLPAIKVLLRNDFDFESVYAQVRRDGGITAEDKALFQEVILDSYISMDEGLRRYVSSGKDPYGIYSPNVMRLIASFVGVGQETGVHFTLNQDLFMERQTQVVPLGLLTPSYRDYGEAIRSHQLDPKVPIRLPDAAELETFKSKYLPSTGGFTYIKLHGSHGWQSSNGASQMVLGNNKLEDIKAEPLLNWYLDLFQEAIFSGDARLFVMGYGFRDEHINACILKAVQEHGLKLYILSPEDPEKLKNRLEGKPDQPASWMRSDNYRIWEAVEAYFPYRLRDIYPADQSPTHIASDIARLLKI